MKLETEGRQSYDAWNHTSVDLVKAAKVRLCGMMYSGEAANCEYVANFSV